MRIAINVAAFYIAWFLAVFAAAGQRPAAAAAGSLAAIALHLLMTSNRAVESKLLAAGAFVGLILEALLMWLGLARYSAPGPIVGWPPLWLVLLWMAFATLINVSLVWLKERLGLAAVLAAAGGPASYYAGARLGGMELSEPLWLSLGAVAAGWAIAFPLLIYLARRMG